MLTSIYETSKRCKNCDRKDICRSDQPFDTRRSGESSPLLRECSMTGVSTGGDHRDDFFGSGVFVVGRVVYKVVETFSDTEPDQHYIAAVMV